MDFTEIDREDFRNLLIEIGQTSMPFGKFGPKDYPPRGIPIMDLPADYLEWFKLNGFPKGRLGELLESVHDLKDVGMDLVFEPMRKLNGGRCSVAKRKPPKPNF